MPSLLLSTEEVVEGKNAILIGMSQWNSNDLVEQMETIKSGGASRGEILLPWGLVYTYVCFGEWWWGSSMALWG